MQGFFNSRYHFLKLAKPNPTTALSESEEDGDERSESSYDAFLSRLWKKNTSFQNSSYNAGHE